MNFDEYQAKAKEFDTFESTTDLNRPEFLEKVLGLAGESGETTDKIKKIIRDKGGRADTDDVEAIKKELGDVIWYVASIARYLGIPFSEVAKENIKKLSSRKKRGKLHGEGDDR